jgi:branched-chain amino acid transport system permease protein
LFKSEAVFGPWAKHWNMGLGLTIIATVVLLPRGLIGLPELVKERLMGRRNTQEGAHEAA